MDTPSLSTALFAPARLPLTNLALLCLMQVVLCELTTLLLTVCDSPVCRVILSKPAWVSLLLHLVRLGPLASAQQRGLRLLRSLLPSCPPAALTLVGPLQSDRGMMSMAAADDPLCAPKRLLLFLLDLVARPFLRASAPPPPTPPTPASGSSAGQGGPMPRSTPDAANASAAVPVSSVALSNEALALLGTLLHPSCAWAEATSALLLQALDSLLTLRSLFAESLTLSDLAALAPGSDDGDDESDPEEGEGEVHMSLRYGLSALAVLGGHVAFLYPGCRAELAGPSLPQAYGNAGATAARSATTGNRRRGLVARLDLIKGEAEIRLDPVVRPAAQVR